MPKPADRAIQQTRPDSKQDSRCIPVSPHTLIGRPRGKHTAEDTNSPYFTALGSLQGTFKNSIESLRVASCYYYPHLQMKILKLEEFPLLIQYKPEREDDS